MHADMSRLALYTSASTSIEHTFEAFNLKLFLNLRIQ